MLRIILLRIFLFTSLVCFSNYSFGQTLEINCGNIRQVISDFKQGDWYKINNQYPVKAHIIGPINQSTAVLEIRIYRYCTMGTNIMDVFGCENDTVKAVRYAWIDLTSHSEYSEGKPIRYKLIVDKQPLRLKKTASWDLFFSNLIKNHLFSLPDAADLNNEVLSKNPKTVIGGIGDGCRTVIEIKLKDGYRAIELHQSYYPAPLQIRDYIYTKNINEILNDLQPDYNHISN